MDWHAEVVDEYANDMDVGYVREYIRGQAAFKDMELDLRDEECRSASLKLYHQMQQNPQVCPTNGVQHIWLTTDQAAVKHFTPVLLLTQTITDMARPRDIEAMAETNNAECPQNNTFKA